MCQNFVLDFNDTQFNLGIGTDYVASTENTIIELCWKMDYKDTLMAYTHGFGKNSGVFRFAMYIVLHTESLNMKRLKC